MRLRSWPGVIVNTSSASIAIMLKAKEIASNLRSLVTTGSPPRLLTYSLVSSEARGR